MLPFRTTTSLTVSLPWDSRQLSSSGVLSSGSSALSVHRTQDSPSPRSQAQQCRSCLHTWTVHLELCLYHTGWVRGLRRPSLRCTTSPRSCDGAGTPYTAPSPQTLAHFPLVPVCPTSAPGGTGCSYPSRGLYHLNDRKITLKYSENFLNFLCATTLPSFLPPSQLWLNGVLNHMSEACSQHVCLC